MNRNAEHWIRYHSTAGRRPIYGVGAKVKTDYIKAERDRERVVTRVYPAPHACQTGWHVETACGLDLDSGWFTECAPDLPLTYS
jgi:hypothetical protein